VISDVINETERKMKKAVEAAQHDYTTIRTGRANPQLLERITVDMYGSPMPVNQLATISVPEPRQLVIAPWDKTAIAAIERAIQKSDLGLTPSSDGNVIRLNIPHLTEERRREMIKVLHKKAEEHRVAVRNVRRDGNEELTDKYIEQIDIVTHAKEAELMEV